MQMGCTSVLVCLLGGQVSAKYAIYEPMLMYKIHIFLKKTDLQIYRHGCSVPPKYFSQSMKPMWGCFETSRNYWSKYRH